MKNTKQRKELAHAFRVAQKYLASTRSEFFGTDKQLYICYALDEAEKAKEISLRICDIATCVVMDRIRPHATYANWLRNKSTKWEHLVDDDSYSEYRKAQAGRLAWLKDLEREFSEPV